jgi:hypothetical protein
LLRYKIGGLNWLLCFVVFFFTWGFGLCCLGLICLFIDGLKDIEHVHPVTGQVVGVYKRL